MTWALPRAGTDRHHNTKEIDDGTRYWSGTTSGAQADEVGAALPPGPSSEVAVPRLPDPVGLLIAKYWRVNPVARHSTPAVEPTSPTQLEGDH